jgi:hypothetical protein
MKDGDSGGTIAIGNGSSGAFDGGTAVRRSAAPHLP